MAQPKSHIWKYFRPCGPENKNKAECLLCDPNSKARFLVRGKTPKAYSTKPLWNHLQNKHIKVGQSASTVSLLSCHLGAQSTRRAIQEQNKIWDLKDLGPQKASQNIDEMMTFDAEPSTIIEQEGFKRFLKHLAPHYSVPSKSHFIGKFPGRIGLQSQHASWNYEEERMGSVIEQQMKTEPLDDQQKHILGEAVYVTLPKEEPEDNSFEESLRTTEVGLNTDNEELQDANDVGSVLMSEDESESVSVAEDLIQWPRDEHTSSYAVLHGTQHKMTWSHEDEERLINLVREKNLQLKGNVWRRESVLHEITEAMRESVPEVTLRQVEARWQTLKTIFSEYEADKARKKPSHYNLLASFLAQPLLLEGRGEEANLADASRRTPKESSTAVPGIPYSLSEPGPASENTVSLGEPVLSSQDTSSTKPNQTVGTPNSFPAPPCPYASQESCSKRPRLSSGKQRMEIAVEKIAKELRSFISYYHEQRDHEMKMKWEKHVNDMERHEMDMEIKREQLRLLKQKRELLGKTGKAHE